MALIVLSVNDRDYKIEVDLDTPLLWALRDNLGLVGTKYGCGINECGACTVHMNGVPLRSCTFRAIDAVGKKITTIEGLAKNGMLHPLQQAWIDQDVPQCGYCQSGQIMSAAALLATNAAPTDEEIDQAMSGNYCRCGTYIRIKSAIKSAAGQLASEASS